MEKMWHIIKLEAPESSKESILTFLHGTEIAGILEEERENSQTILTAYYDPEIYSLGELKRICSDFLTSSGIAAASLTCETAKIDDWTNTWKQWFSPFDIVPGIAVSPSWEDDAVPSNTKIILDPKMAFGTGLHPTTKLCASEIYRLRTDGASLSIIDIGTGSGILAMLAGKLGYKTISAVENDPVAAEIAEENFARNGMPKMSVMPDISKASGTYDVVVSNILLSTLLELKERIINLVSKPGALILSGITHDQVDEILEGYSGKLVLDRQLKMDEWSSLTFRRKR